jgi:hypothetical protein
MKIELSKVLDILASSDAKSWLIRDMAKEAGDDLMEAASIGHHRAVENIKEELLKEVANED